MVDITRRLLELYAPSPSSRSAHSVCNCELSRPHCSAVCSARSSCSFSRAFSSCSAAASAALPPPAPDGPAAAAPGAIPAAACPAAGAAAAACHTLPSVAASRCSQSPPAAACAAPAEPSSNTRPPSQGLSVPGAFGYLQKGASGCGRFGPRLPPPLLLLDAAWLPPTCSGNEGRAALHVGSAAPHANNAANRRPALLPALPAIHLHCQAALQRSALLPAPTDLHKSLPESPTSPA